MEHEATIEGVGVGVGEDGAGAPVVLLRASERLVPIFVSSDQAQSMQLAIENEPFERPLTHDLLIEMVSEFGAAIDRVRIDDLSDGTFYAKIDAEQYVEGSRKSAVFDARPSDGIAIALREDCPVVVSEEVIEQAGRPPEAFEPDDDQDLDLDEPNPFEPGEEDELDLDEPSSFDPRDPSHDNPDESDESDDSGDFDF